MALATNPRRPKAQGRSGTLEMRSDEAVLTSHSQGDIGASLYNILDNYLSEILVAEGRQVRNVPAINQSSIKTAIRLTPKVA